MRTAKQRKMKRLRKRAQALPRTVQQEPISRQAEPDDLILLQERAEGRAVLDNPNQHPTFILRTVKPRLQNGSIIQPPILMDSRIARVGGLEIHREVGERYKAFEHRAASCVLVGGLNTFVTMVPSDDELAE